MVSHFVDKPRERMGNPFEVSVREIAEMVIRIFGSGSELVFEPLSEDDLKRSCPDIR